ASIVDTTDDLRKFVLDDVLQKASTDAELRAALAPDHTSERSALAFEIWAQSMLSHLGFACEVRVFNVLGQMVSEFAVDMPTDHEISERDLLDETRQKTAPVTHTDLGTPGERSYRGAVAIRDGLTSAQRGAVLVDLPVAPSSLDLAANPRARMPELLRNLQEEG